eukprot:TRINITY_DN3382_c0_g5_i1.p1 TRINITY_DN3382_c0_g5~~TRINITY_DN3382_c0_g5_i1.p1  ORF type:complete len:523 (-),score=56.74 TRINITY_DN3382_c0_g5_i1:465-2033(-)
MSEDRSVSDKVPSVVPTWLEPPPWEDHESVQRTSGFFARPSSQPAHIFSPPRDNPSPSPLGKGFVQFINKAQGKRLGLGDHAPRSPAQAVVAVTELASRADAGICCHQFQDEDIVWSCQSCRKVENAVMCDACFKSSEHLGHMVTYFFASSRAGALCDCGDPEAWDSGGWCGRHKQLHLMEDVGSKPSFLVRPRPIATRNMMLTQQQERANDRVISPHYTDVLSPSVVAALDEYERGMLALCQRARLPPAATLSPMTLPRTTTQLAPPTDQTHSEIDGHIANQTGSTSAMKRSTSKPANVMTHSASTSASAGGDLSGACNHPGMSQGRVVVMPAEPDWSEPSEADEIEFALEVNPLNPDASAEHPAHSQAGQCHDKVSRCRDGDPCDSPRPLVDNQNIAFGVDHSTAPPTPPSPTSMPSSPTEGTPPPPDAAPSSTPSATEALPSLPSPAEPVHGLQPATGFEPETCFSPVLPAIKPRAGDDPLLAGLLSPASQFDFNDWLDEEDDHLRKNDYQCELMSSFF